MEVEVPERVADPQADRHHRDDGDPQPALDVEAGDQPTGHARGEAGSAHEVAGWYHRPDPAPGCRSGLRPATFASRAGGSLSRTTAEGAALSGVPGRSPLPGDPTAGCSRRPPPGLGLGPAGDRPHGHRCDHAGAGPPSLRGSPSCPPAGAGGRSHGPAHPSVEELPPIPAGTRSGGIPEGGSHQRAQMACRPLAPGGDQSSHKAVPSSARGGATATMRGWWRTPVAIAEQAWIAVRVPFNALGPGEGG